MEPQCDGRKVRVRAFASLRFIRAMSAPLSRNEPCDWEDWDVLERQLAADDAIQATERIGERFHRA